MKARKRWINDWFPERLNLRILRQNCAHANPYGEGFNYKKSFEELDLEEVKEDLKKVMRESQDWWPADFGHYGPLFIRLAWHSAGSYRIFDGRGGARTGDIRFPMRLDWPDNINLDKAIRLLWPIKQKYGRRISWADLIILAGNVALEDMGVKTIGFAGGREDIWEPDESANWGPEEQMLSGKARFKGETLEKPFAATEMGLIYVNPEGPEGNPDPIAAAKQIRLAFARMSMNDEETVALIAGGHAFGKCHGACPEEYLGPPPDASPLEQQGLGWKNTYQTGKGPDTFTSGFELTWSPTPTKFGIGFLRLLFSYDWELTKSPAGKNQWVAKGAPEIIPDAYDPQKKHRPMILTTDLALKVDPIYSKIAKRFLENPEEFEKAFAKAWFKLTHRDLGPRICWLGSNLPDEIFPWEENLPDRDYEIINEEDIDLLKNKILSSGLSISQLVYTAWSSASTFRISDKKGGANGARLRLKPLRDWEINHPTDLSKILDIYESIKREFDLSQKNNKKVSIADLIVLGGCAAIEAAARKAGYNVKVPFSPGRVDATEEHIDIDLWSQLEPFADGFRNYIKNPREIPAEELLIDKANLLTLSVKELTVLVGGLRALGATYNYSNLGVFTERVGVLSNDFFVNLLDMSVEWKTADKDNYIFYGYERKTGKHKWIGTRVDLIFGHHNELRAVAEVYASADGNEMFIHDFIKAWVKVMELDRFDLEK